MNELRELPRDMNYPRDMLKYFNFTGKACLLRASYDEWDARILYNIMKSRTRSWFLRDVYGHGGVSRLVARDSG